MQLHINITHYHLCIDTITYKYHLTCIDNAITYKYHTLTSPVYRQCNYI